MSRDDDVAALAAEVTALRRTVELLAEILARKGTISAVERRDLIRAARRTRDTWTDDGDGDGEEGGGGDGGWDGGGFGGGGSDDGDSDRARPGHALAGSPYRGASPVEGVGCALCGRALEADDPELTLGRRGKVCTVCFTRGR